MSDTCACLCACSNCCAFATCVKCFNTWTAAQIPQQEPLTTRSGEPFTGDDIACAGCRVPCGFITKSNESRILVCAPLPTCTAPRCSPLTGALLQVGNHFTCTMPGDGACAEKTVPGIIHSVQYAVPTGDDDGSTKIVIM